MTRARKRKVESQRGSLWDVVVKWDDICFKHIIPRLNGTDVKFLYEVNTETRKLIKRSSRKGDLKEAFRVEEMSSISTLEFAWENKSLWPSYWDEQFCCRVAETNKLELLKWAREEKKCDWDYRTIDAAAPIVHSFHSHFFSSRAHLSNSSLFFRATFQQNHLSSILNPNFPNVPHG